MREYSGVIERVDFFVSYTQADRPWAEWIAWQLEANDYRVLIQAWDFRPGQSWAIRMREAADQAERTLAVISPAFFTSGPTAAEWAAAFADDTTGSDASYVPVRVRECKIPKLLKPTIYIDLVGLEIHDAKEALLAGVAAGRAKPKQEPAFPGATTSAESAVEEPEPTFPGDTPPIWNIPPETARFEGREAPLQQLNARLAGGGRAAVTHAYAIHGLGGVGKTQLVTRYAHLHQDEYDVGWWIRAERETTGLEDLATLGMKLGLPEAAGSDQPALVAATLEWLSRSQRWLLVIDNAPDPDTTRGLLPQAGRGHVLVTSRANADWDEIGAHALPLDVWKREESVEFLQARTERAEPSEADAIAELLGDLPLALAQAASYTNTKKIGLGGYRKRLLNDTGGLLGKGKAGDYKDTVASSWLLAFEQISDSPETARLLDLCAYLAPERIPRELLDQALAPNGQDAAGAADDAIEQLLAFSMLTPAPDDTLDMHRLVQQVIRARHQTEARDQQVADAALSLLNGTMPTEVSDATSLQMMRRLLPHALAATDRACEQSQLVASVFTQVGVVLQTLGELPAARAAQERALKIKEAAYGPSHPEVAKTLNNLGLAINDLGDLEGARAAQERALKIEEATYGPSHPEVAITLNNLGLVLEGLGDLEGARLAYERALTIKEATYGPSHPELAKTLNNLGLVLVDLGDLEGARLAYERALMIKEATHGPSHPELASTLSNLGLAFKDLGDLEGARAAQERALKIEEATYGPSHPEVARVINNLGLVLEDLGDLEGARATYERALKIEEATYGPSHPGVAITLGNLGNVLRGLGDLQKARAAMARTREIFLATFGDEHPLSRQATRLLAELD
ncbi:MAG TPA: FxSxx-COOH system tetratricopeptide repeat protein [Solirubrobacteraceae bacterium]|jgi:tetratricopeptide (TPR) repeat protein|nr:FxSxx-COOH system tetratricopeptide repeat protein [Solirubrobacteraceae bacterium]